MNYASIYAALIERAKSRVLEEYSESHHIVPKCLGGSNDANNLVDLTAREHYIAHALLCKMHPKHRGIAFAFHMMNVDNRHQRRYQNSGLYDKFKVQLSIRPMTQSHRDAIGNALRGKPKPIETREKLRQANLGKKQTTEHKKRLSEAQRSRVRQPSEYDSRRGSKRPGHSEVMKQKMLGKHKGKRKYNDGISEFLRFPQDAQPHWRIGRLKR